MVQLLVTVIGGNLVMWILFTILFGVAFVAVFLLKCMESEKVRKLKLELAEQQDEFTKTLKAERIRNSKVYYQLLLEDEAQFEKLRRQYEEEYAKMEAYSNSLEKGIELYKEQQRRALVLYPNLEIEIDRMIKAETIQTDVEKARAFGR